MHERDIEPPPRRQLRPFSKLQRASRFPACAHTGCCPSSYPRNFELLTRIRSQTPRTAASAPGGRTSNDCPHLPNHGTPASCSSKLASVRTVLRTISTLSGAHSRTFAPLPACHAAGMASCEGEGERSGSGRTLDDISIRMGRPSVAIQTENENVAGQAPPHRDVLSHIGLGAHAVLAARLTSDHYLLCALQVRRSPDAACNSPDTFCVA